MRGLLALLSLLGAFAAVVTLLALDDGSETPAPMLLVRATPPNPTWTPLPPPTGVALSSGSMFSGPAITLPAVPTAQPGREGPETTLVEVATGRSLRLWQLGEVIVRSTFSPDGRWLVFDRVRDNIGSLLRVDLTQANLKVEPFSDGILPSFSTTNQLAFTTTRSDSLTGGGVDVRIVLPDGTVRTPTVSAGWSMGWSPDGRWLACLTPYTDIETPIALMLYDSQTGAVRKLGEGRPVQGDYRLLPEWSASGRFVSIRFADPAPTVRRVYDVTKGGSSIDLTFDGVWAPKDDALLGIDATTGAPRLELFFPATGQVKPIEIEGQDDPGAFSPGPQLSPDQSWAAVSVWPVPNGRKAPATMISSLNESGISWEVEGSFQAWSPDGKSFITNAAYGGIGCTNGFAINSVEDKTKARCLGDTTAAKYSPSGKLVAYVQPQLSTAGPRFSGQPYLADPRYMETMSNDLYILDLASGQSRKVLTDARGALGCMRWSPDERWLVLTAICDGR